MRIDIAPKRIAQSAGRAAIRLWNAHPVAPGYLYQTIEKWGPLLADGPIPSRLFTGQAVTCDLRDHVQRHMYFYGAYEPIESWLFTRIVRPGDVVIDAGANVGQYSLLAAHAAGPTGRVHAFEPIPGNHARAVAHIEANGLASRVRVNRLAVWDQRATLELKLARNARNAGTWRAGPCPDVAETVTCSAVAIDDYLDDLGIERVDVLKIDVEGAELFALRGARRMLARSRPTILLEISQEHYRGLGYEPGAIADELRPLGYCFWRVHIAAESSHPVSDLSGLSRANIFCHARPLPDSVTHGWSQKAILRGHRSAERNVCEPCATAGRVLP